MKPNRPQRPKPERSRQELPDEMMGSWMQVIRQQICQSLTAKEWAQSRRIFFKALTTGAEHLNSRGVTLSPERYEQITMEVLNGVKLHAKGEAVKYWPGYLLHCFQEHWKVHGEEYYEEGKAIRARVERAMLAFSRPAAAPTAPDPLAALAAVHRLVSAPRKRKIIPPAQTQGTLF